MSSKISGFDNAQVASVGAGRAAQRPQDAASGSAQTTSDPSSDAADNVQITGGARQLADLEQQIRDLPAVNETRVNELRMAIEQGTYTVHPQQIADKLMSLEKALGQLPDADSDASGESGKPE